jgi:HD-GYP domain-containing protein (c-di-GMP phosphodiesterase class II)
MARVARFDRNHVPAPVPNGAGEPIEAQQLRLLVQQMPAIVWTVDTRYRFTSVLGAGLDELDVRQGRVSRAMHDALADTDALPPSLVAHEQALEGQRSSYTASWGHRQYECSVEPLRCEGRIVGSIGVAVDVTEKRRAQNEALVAFEEAVDCLVRAIESRDSDTARHAGRMSSYCTLIAESLGLDSSRCEAIGIASRLHDIGKIGIPDALLLERRGLSEPEKAIIELHCRTGHRILAGAESEILQLAAVIALTHHEWFDGSGYPQGLAGVAIPLPGRIAAIADVFDALTSTRPYRSALPAAQAMMVMRSERGTHFDPELLDLFIEALDRDEASSLA